MALLLTSAFLDAKGPPPKPKNPTRPTTSKHKLTTPTKKTTSQEEIANWNATEAQKYIKESPDLAKEPCIIYRDIWDAKKIAGLKKKYEAELDSGYRNAYETLLNSFQKDSSTAIEGANACLLPAQKATLTNSPAVTPAIEKNYYGVTLHHTLSIPADGPWWVQSVHESNKWADIGYHFIVSKRMPTTEEMEQQLINRKTKAIEVINADEKLTQDEKTKLIRTLEKSTKEGIAARKKIWPHQRELYYAAIRAAKKDPRNAAANCDENAGWFIFQGRPTEWQGSHVGRVNLKVVTKAEAPEALKNTMYPVFEVWGKDEKTDSDKALEYDDNHELILNNAKKGKKRYMRFNEPDATHLMVVDENNNPVTGTLHKTVSHVTAENFFTQLLLLNANPKKEPSFNFTFDPAKLPAAPALNTSSTLLSSMRVKELNKIFSQLNEGQLIKGVGLNTDKIGITMTGSFAPIDPLDPVTYDGYTESTPENKRIPEREAMMNVGQLINHLFQNRELSHIGSHRTEELGDNPTGGCCPGPGAMCMVKGMIDRFVPAVGE